MKINRNPQCLNHKPYKTKNGQNRRYPGKVARLSPEQDNNIKGYDLRTFIKGYDLRTKTSLIEQLKLERSEL